MQSLVPESAFNIPSRSNAWDTVEHSLKDRQIRFCQEYAGGLTAKEAAVRAGYSQAGASSTAARLLELPDVQVVLSQYRRDFTLAAGVRAERVTDELKNIAYANIVDYMHCRDGELQWKDTSELTVIQLAAVKKITTFRSGAIRQIELHCKLEALAKLCRMTGAFEEHDKSSTSDWDTDAEVTEMLSVRGHAQNDSHVS